MTRDKERSDLRACLIQSLQLNPCEWSRAQGAKRPRHDKTPFSLTALATCLYIVNRYSIFLLWLRHLFLKCKHAEVILNTISCAVVRKNYKVFPRMSWYVLVRSDHCFKISENLQNCSEFLKLWAAKVMFFYCVCVRQSRARAITQTIDIKLFIFGHFQILFIDLLV